MCGIKIRINPTNGKGNLNSGEIHHTYWDFGLYFRFTGKLFLVAPDRLKSGIDPVSENALMFPFIVRRTAGGRFRIKDGKLSEHLPG